MRKVGVIGNLFLGPFAKFSPCCVQEITKGHINVSIYWSENSEYCKMGGSGEKIEGKVHSLSYGTTR